MKISLITMHRVPNYGSVLQTYATCKILSDLGHEVEVLDYIPNRLKLSATIFSQAFQKNNLFLPINLAYSMLVNIPKLSMYNRFLNKHITLSKNKFHDLEDVKKNLPVADVYLTGSDQVWNSFYDGFIDPAFFLDYAKGKIKVSYASSFGRGNLDQKEAEILKQYLLRYDFLSVRESSGVEIIKKMGIENAEHVLDPTFLLDKNGWANLLPRKQYKEKYILMYTVNKDESMLIKLVQKIAKAKGLKIYYLHNGLKGLKGCDRIFRNQTPEEFLSLFANADYVIATSFHGTAFALNFNIPFISVLPKKFRARVESILNLTGLSDRMVKDDFLIEKALEPIDYSDVNEILNNERIKSIEYLKKALKN